MNSLEATEIVAPNGKTDNCAKFIIEDANAIFTFQDICMVGQDYVFGCYVKSDDINSIAIGDTSYPASPAWNRVVNKFNADSVDFAIKFVTPGTYYLYNSKLEIGTVDTDWTPAPEDIFEKSASIEVTLDGITQTVTDLEGNVSKVEQTAESLTQTITDVEGNVSQLQQTVDGFEQTVGDLEGNYSSLQQTVNGISSTVTDVEGNVSSLTQTVNGISGTVGDLEGNYSQLTQTVNGFEVSINNANSTANSALSAANTASGDLANYVIDGTPVGSGSLSGWQVVDGVYQRTFPGGENHVDFSTQSARRTWGVGQALVFSAEFRVVSGTFSSSDAIRIYENGGEWNSFLIRPALAAGGGWVQLSATLDSTGVTTTASKWYGFSSYVTSSGAKVLQMRNVQILDGNAAKTATNYLRFDSSGLCVGNMTGTLGYNALITSSQYQIRNGSTVLSSFGATTIHLGQNSSSAVTYFAGNHGYIRYASNTFQINSDGAAQLVSGSNLTVKGGAYATTLLGGSSSGSVTIIQGNTVRCSETGTGDKNYTPVYRLNNPYQSNAKMWTANVTERNSLINAGWTSEGTGWYAFA